MLTLGSIARDASYAANIRVRHEIIRTIASDRRAHDACVTRRVAWFLTHVATAGRDRAGGIARALGRRSPSLEHLPTTSKSTLRARADAVRRDPASPPPQRLWWTDATPYPAGDVYPEPEAGPQRLWWADTSGSTGQPLTMVFDRRYFLSYFAHWLHFLDVHALEPQPYALSQLHVVGGPHRKSRSCELLQPVAGYSLYRRINVERGRRRSAAALVRATTEESPDVLSGTPTRLDQFVALLTERPPAGRFAPRLVTSTAEALLPVTRARFEDFFRAPVFNQYGLTEAGGVIARECRMHDGFHVLSPDYVVEVVDADGHRVPDGTEGEIAITNLESRLVPVVRYRTGDFGTVTRLPCRCGLVTPRIARLAGRTITRFRLPDGRTVSPFDEFGPVIGELPLDQFQMVQTAPCEVVLSYTSAAPVDDLPAAAALRERVRSLFGDGARCRLVRVRAFARGRKFESWLNRGND